MRKLTFVLVALVAFSASAQNTVRYSQINFAQGINNPAAIAIDGSIMVDLIYRNQWFGVDGAPNSVAMNGQYEINQSMAVGLVMGYDGIGVNQTTSFAGQYAYRVHFENSRSLAFGLGIGADNVVSNFAGSKTTQSYDPAFAVSYSKMYFNGNFGVFYNSPRFYLGAAIPKLFQNTNRGPEPGLQPPRWHYYFSSGFYIHAGKNYTFNPHLQVKLAAHAPFQGDLILRNTLYNRFSLVVGYRSENSIVAGFDVLFARSARVGYSFNYDLGPLAKIKGSSNELYLGLAFPYHSDREDFGKRRYYTNGGGHKSDFRKNSQRKHFRRGRPFGNKKKYR